VALATPWYLHIVFHDVKITNYSAQPHLIAVMTNYLLPVRSSEDGSTQLSKSLLAMFSINDNIKWVTWCSLFADTNFYSVTRSLRPSHLHLPPTYMFEGFGEQFHTLGESRRVFVCLCQLIYAFCARFRILDRSGQPHRSLHHIAAGRTADGSVRGNGHGARHRSYSW
jgi:hypothetical protein